MKKSMQIWIRKIQTQKSLRNLVCEGLGLHLGRVWEALGTLLGALKRCWVVFWAFKTELL